MANRKLVLQTARNTKPIYPTYGGQKVVTSYGGQVKFQWYNAVAISVIPSIGVTAMEFP